MDENIKVDGFPVICHGAQNIYYKRACCYDCPLFVHEKYPPCIPSWRIHGHIKKGLICNIQQILKI